MTEQEGFVLFVAAICFATDKTVQPAEAIERAKAFVTEAEQQFGSVSLSDVS